MGQAAALGRVGGVVGLAVTRQAARDTRPARVVTGRGRTVAIRVTLGLLGRPGAIMAVAPTRAAPMVRVAPDIAPTPGAAPASAAALAPPPEALPIDIPVRFVVAANGKAGVRVTTRGLGGVAVTFEGLALSTGPFVGRVVTTGQGRPPQADTLAVKAKAVQVGLVTLGHVLRPDTRLATGVGTPVHAAPPPRTQAPIPVTVAGRRVAGVRGEVGPVDMAAQVAIGAAETALGPTFLRADTGPGQVEVAVPAGDTPNTPVAVGRLALREGRPTDTGDAPYVPARDIGALRPPFHIPFLVEAARLVLAPSPPPQETFGRVLAGVRRLGRPTPGTDTLGPSLAVVGQAAAPGRTV